MKWRHDLAVFTSLVDSGTAAIFFVSQLSGSRYFREELTSFSPSGNTHSKQRIKKKKKSILAKSASYLNSAVW